MVKYKIKKKENYGFTECGECEAEVPIEEYEPLHVGRSSGPPELCFPDEGGYCSGPDKCPGCGADLGDEFWESVYQDVVAEEEEARADYLADEWRCRER